jgi:predicted nucleic acid-binding protein
VTGEDQPLTQVEAWCTLDKWIEDPRITFLDEPSTIDAAFRYHARLSLPAPKAWSDQYLIAFAQCAGVQLVTLDHALHRRFAGAKLIH